MNKQELVEAVSAKLGADTPKRQVEDTLNQVLEEIGLSMRKGESVQLTGFGTFAPRKRAARSARNPRTGERVRVRATTVPAFKAGKSLKDIVARRAAAKKSAGKKAAKKKKAAGRKAAGKKASKAGKKTAKRTAQKTAKKTTRKTAKKSARKKAAKKR